MTIPPSKKQILKSSIPSSHHTISESFNNKLQEHITIPIITTLPKHSSAIKKSNQKKSISKSKEKVENLKITNLIPSLPYVTSSTDCNRLESNSKYPESPLLSPVTNGAFHTSLTPSVPHTVDIHDPKKNPNTKATNNSTEYVENKLITSNRRHHPPRIKYFT